MTVVTDYSTVTAEWLTSTAASLLAEATADVERIEALPDDELTFDSTVGAIDAVIDIVSRTDGELSLLGHVHPDEAVRTAAQAVEQEQSKFTIDTWGRPALYSRVAAYADSADGRALTGDRAKLLSDTLVRFREAGHQLAPEAKDELGRLSKRAVELSSEFAANLGAITSHLDIPRDELTGMPDSWLDSLDPGDELGTVRVTSAYPHVFPLLESATSRRWRAAVQTMSMQRAVDVNRPLLEEQLVVRKEIATLFGEPSWAHHRLRPRMARTPETVDAFYADLTPRLALLGEKEHDALQALLEADLAAGETDGEPVLGDHDWRYYDSRQRQAQHGVDPWVVAEHFPLDAVLTGLLDLTAEMFGIRYEPVEISTWHPDVTCLRIVDDADGREIATVHLDLFPRDGKFTHAAAFEIVTGRLMPDCSYRRPVTAMVTNFTAPTGDAPSLLTHGEVVTLFHEWGHVLHMSLTEARFAQHAGARTEWDFVEAPSQILEHWAWDPNVLSRFARHHVTGAPLPDDLLAGMIAARNLNEALRSLRQVALGVMDQRLHGADQPVDTAVVLDEFDRISLVGRRPGTFFLAQFGHTMGGYDAAYYGYLWSEVYGDDMFSVFAENGVTNPEIGRRYRSAILAKGGSEDGMTLLRGFLGREPRQDAFLRGKGLRGKGLT
jgi:thimet oligopeptidase